MLFSSVGSNIDSLLRLQFHEKTDPFGPGSQLHRIINTFACNIIVRTSTRYSGCVYFVVS
ncbi:hypothetical protein HanRHA438_Chr04g0188331 [Helianthus annuus]|nr:hypothetical protein HanRHA438_Chr04g0188331 [Helianthus annuus]